MQTINYQVSIMQDWRQHLFYFTKLFLLGCIIMTTIGLLQGWTWGENAFWGVFRTGMLVPMITMVNGYIADSLKISWTEQTVRRLLVSFLLTIVATLAIALTVDVVVDLLRYGRLPQRWFALGRGYYLGILVITFLVSLFMHSRSFLLNYREAIVEKEELKRASLASKYENLQNQVNPHFLFNSLNVLISLVYKDADMSAQFIQQLSQVYRYVLESQHQEVVPLQQELEMLESYLFLLKIRFNQQLDIKVEVDEQANVYLPPLGLQMLVENAVKHNIASKKRPLQVRITSRAGEEQISVWNNYQPKQQLQDSLGVGLKNIKERYRLLSGATVAIQQDEEAFQVSLPLLKM